MNRFKNEKSSFIKFNTKPIKKHKKSERVKKIIIYLISFFSFFIVILCIAFYIKFILPLPDVKKLENLNLAKSSIIYDRKGNELYKVYKENRTYVNFDKISKNMINALIAGEDKTFLKNTGVDFKRMIGAIVYFVLGKKDKIEGTSTITQQLIRNTIIENRSNKETVEEKIERKVKEIYLSYKLSSSLSKEKIIELYLNKIDFGSNSYGIEQASKTFFGKSAKDIGILESSILASIPKGPTFYSPYRHPENVLGYVYFYDNEKSENEEESAKIIKEKSTKILRESDRNKYKNEIKEFFDYINGFTLKKVSANSGKMCGLKKGYHKNSIKIDSEGCSILEYNKLLNFLNGIRIEKKDGKVIEYQTGRKDFILQRMLEDLYINFDEYKKALITGVGYKFKEIKVKINSPHFVFYIKEFLEKKYGKDFLNSGGLRIYTTLDPDLQKKAEEIIEKYGNINEKKYGAKNACIVSINNETGEIVAMVGGRDYFNEEIGGNINMTTSLIQPGSSFKPIVYANAINEKEIGSKTPIFDLRTRFPGGYTPNNFDGGFLGLMNISTALNSSRNIPAIKMVYLGGGEKKVVDFTKKLGFKSIKEDNRYGGTIGLGTAEVTPLEMAEAYSIFANLGKRKDLNPILKIVDSRGLTVEEKKQDEGKEVIDSSVAYIMNYIMSDSATRPSFWNKYLTLNGRKATAKTGTSTKQYKKNGRKVILPRNLWTIGYTPQMTTVVWVGNSDGKATNTRGNGLEAAGPIRKDFMEYAHKGKEKMFWNRPSSVREIMISRLTGFPIKKGRGNITDISLFKNIPTGKGSGLKIVKVDALCNGKVSELTPTAGIKDIYTVDINSLLPNNPAWNNPVKSWVRSGGYRKMFPNIIASSDTVKGTICQREENPDIGNIHIASRISDKLNIGENEITLAYVSDTPIIKFDILIDDSKIDEIILPGKNEGSYHGTFNIPKEFDGVYDLTIRAVNNKYYSRDDIKQIKIGSGIITEKNSEKINNDDEKILNINNESNISLNVTNPSDKTIKLYPFQKFNLRGNVKSNNGVKIDVYLNNKLIKGGIKDKNFVTSISSNGLESGVHEIKINVTDDKGNQTSDFIQLEIL